MPSKRWVWEQLRLNSTHKSTGSPNERQFKSSNEWQLKSIDEWHSFRLPERSQNPVSSTIYNTTLNYAHFKIDLCTPESGPLNLL